MRPLALLPVIATLVLGTACDTSYVTEHERYAETVSRDDSRIEFDITATASSFVVVDVLDENATLFSPDDRPSSTLSVELTLESRGFLGFGVRETFATARLETGSGEVLADSFSVVDGEPLTLTLHDDNVDWRCSEICFEAWRVIVEFDDPRARVATKLNAGLRVDYDEFVPEPQVELYID